MMNKGGAKELLGKVAMIGVVYGYEEDDDANDGALDTDCILCERGILGLILLVQT